MKLFTIGWSSRSSAGTMVVVEETKERAMEIALSYYAADELSLESEETCIPGTHVLITTDRRPI